LTREPVESRIQRLEEERGTWGFWARVRAGRREMSETRKVLNFMAAGVPWGESGTGSPGVSEEEKGVCDEAWSRVASYTEKRMSRLSKRA